MADSRPAPGPFTHTSTVLIPCSMAFLAAFSEAIWAANGVLFLEPLKPWLPELDQQTTFPFPSVMVTMVLLKEASMCATPTGMFFFSFLGPLLLGPAISPPDL